MVKTQVQESERADAILHFFEWMDSSEMPGGLIDGDYAKFAASLKAFGVKKDEFLQATTERDYSSARDGVAQNLDEDA